MNCMKKYLLVLFCHPGTDRICPTYEGSKSEILRCAQNDKMGCSE